MTEARLTSQALYNLKKRKEKKRKFQLLGDEWNVLTGDKSVFDTTEFSYWVLPKNRTFMQNPKRPLSQ